MRVRRTVSNATQTALAFLVALFVILGSAPAPVSAHADLVSSDPAAGAELRQAPSAMTLTFSQGLKSTGSFVQLTDSKSTQLTVQATYDATNPKLMRTTLPALTPDVYIVKWQTLSADDDDYHDGTFTFVVLQPDGSRPPAASGGTGETSSESTEDDDSGGNAAGPLIIAAGAALALIGGAYMLTTRRRKGPA